MSSETRSPEPFAAPSTLLLALETTCDETAAAVIAGDLAGESAGELVVRSSVVSSQHDLHQRFRGVVPEIAARAHVERILPVIDEALRVAGVSLDQIDAIAVANTPGLAGSLLVGLMAAKSLCLALGKPLLAVDHLHAHIYACRMAAGREVFPCVGLIVSGGHTSLYRCATATEFAYLGGTIDDAAGEAFDKIAALLGLPYPGGPSVSAAAEKGDLARFAFPRSFVNDRKRLDFSFSGLKTAVRYAIAPAGQEPDASKLSPQEIADLCASFEQAVIDCLATKALAALSQTSLARLCVGGGVAANRRLRERLAHDCETVGAELFIAPLELCTDNAVMGAIAFERLRAGLVENLDLDVLPGRRVS
jgi:N6-L-threonylcarbamoyladenine synthase